MRRNSTVVLLAALFGLLGSYAAAATANFDSKTYGLYGKDFQDGGIRFYDLVSPANESYQFYVQWVGPGWSSPGFSVPNILGFGDHVPLSQGLISYAPVYECKMALATPGPADHASVDLFTDMGPGLGAGNSITLEAWRGGSVVNSVTVTPSWAFNAYYPLSLSGVRFDYLRLVGSGSWNNGLFYAIMDNVVITPEPATLSLLALGGLLLARRRQA